MSKLLREETFDIVTEIIDEAAGAQKSYILGGMFMQAETPNKNGRIYPRNVLESELNRYLPVIAGKRTNSCGELGHPATPQINLDRVSHRITELRFDGNNVIGKAKVMDTPYGKIVKNFIDEGVVLGMSTRGVGSIKEINGINIVQEDFKLATVDIVSDPSGPECFVNGIYENAEWVFVDGFWTQKDIETSRKQLIEANYRDINNVALNIFNNFLKKLK